MQHILAADIGGTNSRFACFHFDEKGLRLNRSVWLKTAKADSFAQLLTQLGETNLDLTPASADASVFAVAGPVLGRKTSPPNITWDIDLEALPQSMGIHDTLLINDFVAQGYSCVSPIGKEALPVITGKADNNAPIAVLGAGTGLGKCLLVPINDTYHAVASEGGHATFPFTTEEEIAFAAFLRKKRNRSVVDGDMVVSGSGFSALYEFHTGKQRSSKDTIKTLSNDSNILQQYARFYGRAAKNYALNTLALGGVFISGGVAAGNPNIVCHAEFIKEFQNHETYHELLTRIPVSLNRNEEAGLWGAAYYGLLHLQHSTMA